MGFMSGTDFPRASEVYEDPPHLVRPTKVRSIGRAFAFHGKRIEVGDVVTVPSALATELIALGRARLIE